MERARKEHDCHQSGISRRVAQGRFSRSSRQKDLASGIDGSPLMVAQRRKLQTLFGGAAQLQEESASRPNNTGLPDNLKSGIENLSGMSMDHVKVHYNSSMPAQLNALAYAQGSDIHIAPGQEKHLPHEAWHVVQQAQGRVKPTIQMKGGVAVNDDGGLEREADAMGGRCGWRVGDTEAVSVSSRVTNRALGNTVALSAQLVTQRAIIATDRLNVAGEKHNDSDKRRIEEKEFASQRANGVYWEEHDFPVNVSINGVEGEVAADSLLFQWLQVLSRVLLEPLEHGVAMKSTQEHALIKEYVLNYKEWVFELITVNDELKKLTQEEKIRIDSRLNLTKINVKVDALLQSTIVNDVTAIYEVLKEKIEKETEVYDIRQERKILFGVYQKALGMLNLVIEKGSYFDEIIAFDRSLLMADAAQKHHDRRGIWKIGSLHAIHLKHDLQEVWNFNLLDRQEFEGLFEEWTKERVQDQDDEGLEPERDLFEDDEETGDKSNLKRPRENDHITSTSNKKRKLM